MNTQFLRAIVVTTLIAGTVLPAAAQTPAAPAPAAPATPAPTPPTPQSLEPIIQQALDAYNSGDFAKFFAVYAGPNVVKPDAKAFAAVLGEFQTKFGRYLSRTMKPEWNDLNPEAPRIAYVGAFQKLPKANLSFRFKRTPQGFKIDEISILDANVNN
jgi:hypothetical protein